MSMVQIVTLLNVWDVYSIVIGLVVVNSLQIIIWMITVVVQVVQVRIIIMVVVTKDYVQKMQDQYCNVHHGAHHPSMMRILVKQVHVVSVPFVKNRGALQVLVVVARASSRPENRDGDGAGARHPDTCRGALPHHTNNNDTAKWWSRDGRGATGQVSMRRAPDAG